MSGKDHHYSTTIRWTGNTGSGTSSYRSYERSHLISSDGKPDIPASSDPTFRGDKTRYNPEDLLLASVSSCHMLWYLHLCAEAGVIVLDYVDHAEGTMTETADGSGRFTQVVLQPQIVVAEESMADKAHELHHKANSLCFIANSVNFPVKHQATITVADRA